MKIERRLAEPEVRGSSPLGDTKGIAFVKEILTSVSNRVGPKLEFKCYY